MNFARFSIRPPLCKSVTEEIASIPASIVRDCSVSEGPDNRFLKHKCLANFGYSGAPILAQIGDITTVIGINSVGDPQQRTGMACSATQFAKAVAELTQSEGYPGAVMI